ncbi:MAG: hypothetical protein H7336_14985 [Bacteriovorax sp.]|nr:hypothetical protein [Bacteriovorax sp.]
MFRRNLALIIALLMLPLAVHATDLDHAVSGDTDVEDTLATSTVKGNSPYIVEGEPGESVENSKANGTDSIFNHGVKEVSTEKISEKKKLQDVGYTPPGTFEGQANYIDLDKKKLNKDFRKASAGGINLTFIKNDYDYQSTNDIINRTIGMGYKHIKGGALHVRNDSYIFKTAFLNFHWSVGGGMGFNSGRGIFVDGKQSDATFKLWEFPIDAGLGIEIPIANWFKFAGTGGPSVLTLLQDRSDLGRGEAGKRKFQFSPGYFASAQFKINLLGFNDEAAYDLFTTSELTNLFMNIEVRHESYSHFADPVQVSGTSYGIGFTFEYL